MLKKKWQIALLAMGLSQSGSALAFDHFFQSGRTAGKGSANSTVGHWSNASSYNPALIAQLDNDQKFFFTLPNVSGRLALSESADDLTNRFDNFDLLADDFERYDNIDLLEGDIAQLNQVVTLTEQLISQIGELDGLGGQGGANGNFSLGWRFNPVSIGLHGAVNVTTGGTVSVTEQDLVYLTRYTELADVLIQRVRPKYDELTEIESELLAAQLELVALQENDTATVEELFAAQQLVSDTESTLAQAELTAEELKNELVGVETSYGDIFDADTQSTVFDTEQLTSSARFVALVWQEAGITLGKSIKLNHGKSLRIGTTIKQVNLDFYDYTASINDTDLDSIDSEQYSSNDTFVTGDVGVILGLDPKQRWFISATAKNVISAEVQGPEPLEQDKHALLYQVEPQVRIGMGFENRWLALAAELDVIEAQGPVFIDGPNAGESIMQGSQYFNTGIELKLSRFGALRAGYRHNLASKQVQNGQTQGNSLITLGAGISVNSVHFDLALQASGDGDEIGFALQTMTAF